MATQGDRSSKATATSSDFVVKYPYPSKAIALGKATATSMNLVWHLKKIEPPFTKINYSCKW